MIFFLLINVKMPTPVGILTLMSRKTSTLGLSEPKQDLSQGQDSSPDSALPIT